MSIKSLIQVLISLLIILIIFWVYLEYFNTNKKVVEEMLPSNMDIEKLENKISDLETKNKELTKQLSNNNKNDQSTKSEKIKNEITTDNFTNDNNNENKDINKKVNIEKKVQDNENKIKKESEDIKINKEIKDTKSKNLLKDVEYTSVDQKGNKFYLLATSAKSNIDNKDILDLENVRGKITSDVRDTIFIVSDYAQYNTINLNSKFKENVIIDYQNKQITCINFDINMETNKAIAYNDVIITDPNSVIVAGVVEFDLETKDIDIKPENSISEVVVVTN